MTINIWRRSFKQDCIIPKDPLPHMAFSVPKRNKKLVVWRRRKNVHLKTHATERGMGKKYFYLNCIILLMYHSLLFLTGTSLYQKELYNTVQYCTVYTVE